jgi:hypothetical protein
MVTLPSFHAGFLTLAPLASPHLLGSPVIFAALTRWTADLWPQMNADLKVAGFLQAESARALAPVLAKWINPSWRSRICRQRSSRPKGGPA